MELKFLIFRTLERRHVETIPFRGADITEVPKFKNG